MNDLLLFVSGPLPGTALAASYNGWLVGLSYVVAALASYTAIDLAGRVRVFRADPGKSAVWLAAGAITMGAGIWAMHIVGMLACQLPVPVRYDLWTTLVSLTAAIVASACALYFVACHTPTAGRLALSGTLLGAGIGAMHYTGMAAMRLDALVMYYAGPFTLSIVNAVVCSTAALWLMSRHAHTEMRSKVFAALIMGVAMMGMHYTGMYATVCVSTGKTAAAVAGIDPVLMALAVSVITLLVMGTALAVSLQSQHMTQALREQNRLLEAEIAHRRRAEGELQEHRDNLQATVEARTRNYTFDHAAVGIAHFSLQQRNLRVNRRYCEIVGYTPDELLDKPTGLPNLPGDADNGSEQRDRLLSGAIDHFSVVQRYQRKDGRVIWVTRTESLARDSTGAPEYFIRVIDDITEKVKAEHQIEQLVTKDALTGLSNRSSLMEQMQAAIKRAARAGTKLALMFVDLDRFKEVNDTLGHAAGDELLRECAKRLTTCVREVDVVARLGGDEFVVLVTDATDTTAVSPIAKRMLDLLAAPYHLLGYDARSPASIGICIYPKDGKDVDTLMKNADIAMYQAKGLGRNNYQFYAEEMNQRMIRRLQLSRELRAAVENNEFVLHYQPQVVVATGEIRAVESLIRWQHPIRGLLPPVEFIQMAEDTGLIVPIGEWVLDHACRTISSWREKGVAVPYVVVNISAAQLGDGLVDSVRRALVTHDIEPGWLMLEITETMLMERVEEAITILRRIRELGVRIAMDDFGTGYSSLSVLQRLPLDTLKIDRSFVAAIDDDVNSARACTIIGAIIAIAKELNLSVVAEGVETTTQLAFLHTVNCDSYQGNLYSVPVDTVALESALYRADKMY